jgi:hypothetical protein
VSNFGQFVAHYVPGQVFKAKLTTNWDKVPAREGTTLVIVTQAAMRRAVGIMNTPLTITLQPQDDRITLVLEANSGTSAAHVAKFEEQAAQHKQDKANRALIKTLRESFAALGIDVS